jgi:hypothetical protein
MNIKSFLLTFLISLFLVSCSNPTSLQLIGEWRLEKIELSGNVNAKVNEELNSMKGAVMKFMEEGILEVNFKTSNYQTHWTLNGSKLEIEKGTNFEIITLTEKELILKAEMEFLNNGEMVKQTITQHFTKL